MSSFHDRIPSNMWRVVFYERRGNRVHMDRTGPWLPEKSHARQWADWFKEQGVEVLEVEREAFREKTLPVLNGDEATWTQEQFDRLQAL